MQSSTDTPVVLYQSPATHDVESQTPTANKSFDTEIPSEKGSPYLPETIQPVSEKREKWRKAWNSAIRHGRWPRVVYAVFGLIIGIVWIAVTVYFANSERSFARGQKFEFTKVMFGAGSNSSDETGLANAEDSGIILSGALKNFDQTAGTLTVSWSGKFKNGSDDLDLDYALEEGGPLVPWPLHVYRDVDTTIGFLDNTTDNWFWMLKNSSTPHIATIGNTADDNFDTDIDFQQVNDTGIWQQPLFGYPLDRMEGDIVFVISDADAAQSLNITNYIINLAGAELEDYSLNWRFVLKYEPICKSFMDFSTLNTTQDSWNNATLNSYTFPCHLRVSLTASRPPLVRFAVAMAVLVNWTSTLFIFVLTCESLIMRRGWMLSGTDLLSITFTALFALPTVRMLLPGAPDFGVLVDLVGIIPNVIVVSLCIVAIAVAKLNRRHHKEDDKDKSD